MVKGNAPGIENIYTIFTIVFVITDLNQEETISCINNNQWYVIPWIFIKSQKQLRNYRIILDNRECFVKYIRHIQNVYCRCAFQMCLLQNNTWMLKFIEYKSKFIQVRGNICKRPIYNSISIIVTVYVYENALLYIKNTIYYHIFMKCTLLTKCKRCSKWTLMRFLPDDWG